MCTEQSLSGFSPARSDIKEVSFRWQYVNVPVVCAHKGRGQGVVNVALHAAAEDRDT